MNKVREISPREIQSQPNKYILVDVREPHELIGPEGKIKGAIQAPLGPTLLEFLKTANPEKEYAFICLAGYRSKKACEIAQTYGFSSVFNMSGGMLAWNLL